jgi:ankyrin repeat protein
MDSRRGEAKHDMYPQTCHWILEHETYRSWTNQDHGLLWVKGKPGSGKSTIMSFLYSKLRSETTQEVLILEFFFHGRGSTLQKTPIGMLRTLLHQAIRESPVVRPATRDIFKKKEMHGISGIDWHWQLHELEDMVRQVILEISKSRDILIFIDALDEAGAGAESVLQFLHKMNDEIEEAKSKAKICVACRHYPILTSSIPGLEVVVEDNNGKDIAHYVHSKISSESSAADVSSDIEAWQEIEAEIASKASGLFQWARLVTGLVVEQHREGISWREIRHSLQKVPEGLHAVYRHILDSVVKPIYRKRTQLLMQWVCFAMQPLTLAELRYAMICDNISPSQAAFEESEDFVENDERMKKLITSLSGGLVEVIYFHEEHEVELENIQFIHQSINDFIRSGGIATGLTTSTGSSLDLTGTDSSFLGQSHDRLCRSCVNYLAVANNNDQGSDMTERPFAEYALHYWFKHAGEAEANGVLQTDLVKKFVTFSALWTNWRPVLSSRRRPIPGGLLHVASCSNLQSVVHHLLNNGADVNKQDNRGYTALQYSAMYGHDKMTDTLLDANAKDKYGKSALILAAEHGNLGIIKLLLSRGATINETYNDDEESVLQVASGGGHLSLVRYLLESGADVNAKSGYYCTALQAAARSHHKTSRAIVQFLLDNGAEVNITGGAYGSALLAAASQIISMNKNSIFDLLLRNGADVKAEGPQGNIMHIAAYYGNTSIVKLYLRDGGDVNFNIGEHGSALQAASSSGQTRMMQLLLDAGADVNAYGGTHGSPIQAAAISNNLDLVEMLLDNGADVNAQGGKYGSALQAAAYFLEKHSVFLPGGENYFNAQEKKNMSARKAAWHNICIQIVKLLLDRGANINAMGGAFGNALQIASSRGNKEIAELLLDRGADINAQGGEHGFALHAASFGGNKDIVELLLDRGVDINAQGGEHGFALYAASFGGNKDIVELLLDRGADINAQGGEHGFALHAASVGGNKEIVELLLDRGVDINAQGGIFGFALHAASAGGNKEIVELLLNRGVDINTQEGEHGSALQAASFFTQTVIIRLLLDKGADISARGGKYRSALAAAKSGFYSRERKETVDLLLSKGALWDPDWVDYDTWLLTASDTKSALSEPESDIIIPIE